MQFKITRYQKDFSYSYTLGAFPTLELLDNKSEAVIAILISSSFKNEDVLNKIKEKTKSSNIEVIFDADKSILKVSPKENCYIVGVFTKYQTKLQLDDHHILLDNPTNFGNLGTIMRTSLGFNFRNIAIIKPSCDIFDPKTIRSSMGSIFHLNIELFDSLEDYKERFNNHTIVSFMLQAKTSLQETNFENTLTTLAFGNEAHGLSPKYLDENSIIISHSNQIDSLNITNAHCIALYEFNKQIKNK